MAKPEYYQSRASTLLVKDAMTSDSISPPGITSTTAIPAIYAKDCTFNTPGRDQIFITNIYNVDPNCDPGIWNNQPCDSNSPVVQTKSTSGCPLSSHLQTITELSMFAWKTPVRGSSTERVSYDGRQRLTILFGFAAHVCILIVYESPSVLN
jgi:hypothetical protein